MVRQKDIIGPIVALLTDAEACCARPCELLTQLENRGFKLFPQAKRVDRLRALTSHLWEESHRPGSLLQRYGLAGRAGRYGLRFKIAPPSILNDAIKMITVLPGPPDEHGQHQLFADSAVHCAPEAVDLIRTHGVAKLREALDALDFEREVWGDN